MIELLQTVLSVAFFATVIRTSTPLLLATLGGLVAGLSVASRTELLMIVVGALFVMEAGSVVIQVASYKTTGKRVFRMAPFHHHFENGGWAETTVVVRFWIISAMAVALGLALFYGEWLTQDGVSA